METLIKKIKIVFQDILSRLKQHKIKTIIGFVLVLLYYFSLPSVLFETPYSTVIESKEGELLSAKIASDGQWRFPQQDSIPEKFKQCVVHFEDQYFYKHPGFNPMAIYNAIKQNKKAGKIVRGGSTLTQQVIRLSRENTKRSYFEKVIELILATRLELRHSKEEILNLYAAHAPFGGNVVGLDMAAWRYYGVQPHQLSWAESATLAVLPNAPSLIYPGKNHQILLQKRNRLLKKLYSQGIIDKTTYVVSVLETLPEKPYDLPQVAPHLLQHVAKSNQGKRIITTVDFELQNRVNQIVSQYHNQYKQTQINNIAVLIVEVKTRKVLCYVGNTPTDKEHQKDVDIITAPRSTGSILKPLLYASMLDDGKILPNTLVADIPIQIAGFTPQNFNRTFDGAVPAGRALSRSLNIPSVLMLKDYSVYKFYEQLQKFGLKDINKHPDHYGLSLILGGAESNLWDLCKTYANMSSTLVFYTHHSSQYRKNEFGNLNYFKDKNLDFGKLTRERSHLGAGAIWTTYNSMRDVARPEQDEAWEFFDSSLELAWKTGTSYGNRDAWAIGTSSKYVVGVWVGNASGEGRPSLTGVGSAAPILFDVFNLLPRSKWFEMPYDDLMEVNICKQSGHLAQEYCTSVKQWIPKSGNKTTACPYHKRIHLDFSEQFRVNSNCESVVNMVSKNWFVLPPVMEWYYKTNHFDYRSLPPFKSNCNEATSGSMDFIYPKENGKVYLTKNFNQEVQPFVVKVAHSNPNAQLFWYSNNQFLGKTKTFHEMPIKTPSGTYLITVVDDAGNEIKRKVLIIAE